MLAAGWLALGAIVMPSPLVPVASAEQLGEEVVPPPVHVVGTADDSSLEAAEPAGTVTKIDIQSYLRDYPIVPPDTSSPRASLGSFLAIMREASTIWMRVAKDFQESKQPRLSEEQERDLALVRLLIAKAAGIFDLGDIAETARESASIEIVLQFQEILDRIHLPKLSTVPGESAGSFDYHMNRDSLPDRWTIPGTDIEFAATEGKGSYLVTREAVERIPDDYELIKQFPARSDKGIDLYKYYIYTPGNLVAPRWYDVILAGPPWLRTEFMSQTYWQWIALAALIVISVTLLMLVHRWNRWRAVPTSDFRRQVRRLQFPLLFMATLASFRYLVEQEVNITGDPMVVISTVTTVLMWTTMAWLLYQTIELIASWVMKNPAMSAESLDSSLLRTAFRAFGFTLSVVVMGYGATRIGIPIYGVIAGLGVGGLAVALAAQPTLENLIGGIILYADRMVRVGEYCEFEGMSGTVEAIGIRSTRIRALDRSLITVSNSDLAKFKIVNMSRRDRSLFMHTIGLRYETSPEALERIIEQIRAYMAEHPKVLDQVVLRVTFVAYGNYSLDVSIYTLIGTSDRNQFMEIQQELLFEVGRIVQANGSDFAFPSNVTYLGRDGGLPEVKAEDQPRPAGGDLPSQPKEAAASVA
ncbi:hypothetical protein GCM10007285_05120 [Stappia taiwanensis]|nr:hypothetical protein GCM10007285_05120 [Stappia taiwanensis]